MSSSQITHERVADAVFTLPAERLQMAYDFVQFLKQQSMGLTPENDLFGESAEEIEVDEARWQQQYDASPDTLRAMAQEAAAEYRAGNAEPMQFSEEGRLVR